MAEASKTPPCRQASFRTTAISACMPSCLRLMFGKEKHLQVQTSGQGWYLLAGRRSGGEDVESVNVRHRDQAGKHAPATQFLWHVLHTCDQSTVAVFSDRHIHCHPGPLHSSHAGINEIHGSGGGPYAMRELWLVITTVNNIFAFSRRALSKVNHRYILIYYELFL